MGDAAGFLHGKNVINARRLTIQLFDLVDGFYSEFDVETPGQIAGAVKAQIPVENRCSIRDVNRITVNR